MPRQPWEKEAKGKASGPARGAYLENWAARGPKAVAFGDTYHVSLLRAYPGESGEMLVKRGGARQDMDLLKLSGIAERLSGQNSEALSRPEKWLSRLAASIRQAHRVLPYAEEDPARCGTPQLTASLSDTLLAAATLLDTTQKERGTGLRSRPPCDSCWSTSVAQTWSPISNDRPCMGPACMCTPCRPSRRDDFFFSFIYCGS